MEVTLRKQVQNFVSVAKLHFYVIKKSTTIMTITFYRAEMNK